ncbi:hypothetical protein AgCh_012477 [Apium graveolens]
MDVIIFASSLMLAYVVFKSRLSFHNRGKKLPPGPFQLPIIGNLTKLGKLPHQSLANLAKLYGPIMHLQLGRVTTIVISSSTLAQQVLQKQDLVFSTSQTGESVDIGRAASTTSLNLLSNTIFSKDLANPNEDSAKEFRDLIRNTMVDAGKPNLVDFFPVLKKLDPQGVNRKVTRHYENLIKIFDGLINERLALMRSGHPVEYTDALDERIPM